VTCWLIIPVKPPHQAKSRLSEVLGEDQRATLAGAMLRHVHQAASDAQGVAQIALLGHSRLGLPDDVLLLAEPGGGLNPAAESAFAHVAAEGADRMIVLFADLPLLTSQDVERLATVPNGTIAIAPDRHGTGTNALSLPIPMAKGFTFAFGTDSFAAHRAEAGRLGLRIELVHSPGLARDVDVPDDLADALGMLGPGD
jgi:2-phospho-L-lactate guanylyltransferase